jgi:DNA modification methylase
MLQLIHGDAYDEIPKLESHSIDCVFTSPNPYHCKNCAEDDDPEARLYITELANIFLSLERPLKDSGTFFIHLSDSHNKKGNLRQIPFKFAKLMQDYNWILRSDLIWHWLQGKPRQDLNAFKNDCEHIFMFAKNKNHHFVSSFSDTSLQSWAYYEPKRNEWFSGFPIGIILSCLAAGCPEGGTVLDPMMGSGITGKVALDNGMNFIGIDKDERMVTNARLELEKISAILKGI